MNKSPAKPWYKRWTAWALIVIVVGIIGNLLPDASEDEAQEPEKPAANEAAAPEKEAKEPEAKPAQAEPAAITSEAPTLADTVNEYLGDRRIHGQSVKNGYYTVETDFGDFIGPEFCEEESIDLAQLISEHPDYAATGANGVKVVYISGVTDAYGNSADETVMYIEYSNETIAKINFDTFDTKNVMAVADDYFRMASFK